MNAAPGELRQRQVGVDARARDPRVRLRDVDEHAQAARRRDVEQLARRPAGAPESISAPTSVLRAVIDAVERRVDLLERLQLLEAVARCAAPTSAAVRRASRVPVALSTSCCDTESVLIRSW